MGTRPPDIPLDRVMIEEEWTPFTTEELHDALSGMKVRASVGVDLIGVSLLRAIMADEHMSWDLLQLINTQSILECCRLTGIDPI